MWTIISFIVAINILCNGPKFKIRLKVEVIITEIVQYK